MSEEINNPAHGSVQVAHESRFNAAHFSEPLTAFSAGWKDPENLAELLEFVAPAVPVGRRFEFKKADNAQAFLSETDDIRAIGSAFKRVEYNGTSVNEKTLNKGLTLRVDHDEIINDDWRERYVQILIQRLYRNELRRAVTVLDQVASNTHCEWNNAKNPDADLRKTLLKASSKSGIRPNRLLLGETAWDLRANAYEENENNRSAEMAPRDLARKLLVDDIRVMRARYQANAKDKAHIVGNTVYAYFAQEGATKDEPSNIKRFLTPCESNGPFRVYLEEHTKYTDLTVEHYSNIVVTSEIGIQKITVIKK